MALTEADIERLQRLEALLPYIQAEARANSAYIQRVIEESDRRMAPYEPVFRRIRARLRRAGYLV